MGIKGEPPKKWLDFDLRDRRFQAFVTRSEREAIRRVDSYHQPPRFAVDLYLVEWYLVVIARLEKRVRSHVRAARARGATWDEVASVTGHPSRGAAARHFAEVRGSESETSATT